MLRFTKYKLLNLRDIFSNYFIPKTINYVVEKADWVIKEDGISIISNLKRTSGRIITNHTGIKNKIIHFGSQNIFFGQRRINLPHKSNKIIVTCLHYLSKDVAASLIKDALSYVDIWHTSCNITKIALVEAGIPARKIVMIPLGVNLSLFSKSTNAEKILIRQKLGLPKDRIIIGSFQKDGIGWGSGDSPKLIKGPDIFCDVVELLSQRYPIFVLLTGPARGYVKKRLKNGRIPYRWSYLKDFNTLPVCYKVLDMYIVTSRLEGGPKAILESMASGVPLVTTKVGMAADIIRDGENGFMIEVARTEEIAKKASWLIENEQLRSKFICNGLNDVKPYDWRNIAADYEEKMYDVLLRK